MNEARRYEMFWRNKWLTSEAQTIDDMIDCLRGAADELAAMKEAGITLDPEGGTGDDYATLITSDAEVAAKFGLQQWEDEEEFEEEEEEEEEEEV